MFRREEGPIIRHRAIIAFIISIGRYVLQPVARQGQESSFFVCSGVR
jgi:hypothetical protein